MDGSLLHNLLTLIDLQLEIYEFYDLRFIWKAYLQYW